MLIYRITSYPLVEDTFLNDYGIMVENIVPSSFTFLTSMRIATLCKKNATDAIIANNPSDAYAALSARKINASKNSPSLPYPIILQIDSSSKIPRSITSELARGLDAVIFDSELTMGRWSKVRNFENVKTAVVIETPGDDASLPSPCQVSNTLLYIGPINDGQRLKSMLSSIAKLEDNLQPKVIVAGTGAARTIMPIVKLARANRLDVTWLGDEYVLGDVITECGAFIMSADTPSPLEKRLMANGMPFVDSESVTSWLDTSQRETMSQNSREIYRSKYRPELYAQKMISLIERLHHER